MRILGLAPLLFLLVPTLAEATLFTVDIGGSGDFTDIQSALDAAATTGDTVDVLPGTYSGALDFGGKAVVVQSTAGAAATTIDGGWTSGPETYAVSFVFFEGAGSVLDGFTITNGTSARGCSPKVRPPR